MRKQVFEMLLSVSKMATIFVGSIFLILTGLWNVVGMEPQTIVIPAPLLLAVLYIIFGFTGLAYHMVDEVKAIISIIKVAKKKSETLDF